MYWGQAGVLSISTTTDMKLHKQATNTAIQ